MNQVLRSEGEHSFDEIAEELGCSRQAVIQTYQRAMRKLARDRYAMQVLQDWSQYHWQLRARSMEARAAQEHW